MIWIYTERVLRMHAGMVDGGILTGMAEGSPQAVCRASAKDDATALCLGPRYATSTFATSH